MEYLDFVIQIGPDDGGGHRLHAKTPQGEATSLLVFPWTQEETKRRAASHLAWRSAEVGETQLRVLGGQLFAALFPQPLLELWSRSQAQAFERGLGLRLRLELDPQDAGLRQLFALPWELLNRPREGYLVLSRRTPLVRHPAVPWGVSAKPEAGPLRVLCILAAPADLPPLQLESEWQALADTWRSHPTVEMTRLENVSVATLREALDGGPKYHVLHFMGHGGHRAGEWMLAFCAEDGKADLVTARRLAEQLLDFQDLRLVVLNACHTARVLDEDPAGVAMALVSAGFPAVVGNQAPISDRAAIELTKMFYPRLAAGDSLEKALAIARLHLRDREGRGGIKLAEWATPVLLLRAEDGQLFEVSPERRVEVPVPAPWRPHPLGLAALLAACLGLAGLAAAGALWLWNEKALIYALGMGAGLLAGLGGLGRWLWGDYARKHLTGDLSWWVAQRRAVMAGLLALPLTATIAWLGPAGGKLAELRCGDGGPPGNRLAFVPLSATGPTAVEQLLAAETTEELRSRLQASEAVNVVPWDSSRDPGCFTAVARGSIGYTADQRPRIRVKLVPFGAQEIELEEVGEATGAPSLDYLTAALAGRIVAALDLGPGEEPGGVPAAVAPHARSLNARGFLSFLAGDRSEARIQLQRAIEVAPRYASAHNNLARLLASSRPPQLQEALRHARVALEIAPDNATYRFNHALTLDQLNRKQEALSEYRALLKVDPFHARARNNLGLILLEGGHVQDARKELERAQADADEAEVEAGVAKNLGRAYLASGDPRAAGDHFQRALERRPRFPEALFYRAAAWEELGKTDATWTREKLCAGYAEFLREAPAPDEESRLLAAQARWTALECAKAPAPEREPPTVAIITHLQGPARVSAVGLAYPLPARLLQKLAAGDTLEPANLSRIEILCVDGLQQQIAESTPVGKVCPPFSPKEQRGPAFGVQLDLGNWEALGEARGSNLPPFEKAPMILAPSCPADQASRAACGSLAAFPPIRWLAVPGARSYWLELSGGPLPYPRHRLDAATACSQHGDKAGRAICRHPFPWILAPRVEYRLEVAAELSAEALVRSGPQAFQKVAADDPRLGLLANASGNLGEPDRALVRGVWLLGAGLPNDAIATLTSVAEADFTSELGLLLGEAFLRIGLPEQAAPVFRWSLYHARDRSTLDDARLALDRIESLGRVSGDDSVAQLDQLLSNSR